MTHTHSLFPEMPGVLHFIGDGDDPARIVAELAAALAPGSMIAVSHLTADYAPAAVTAAVAAYNAAVPVAVHPRTREQITGLFGDLPADYPGVVPVTRWRPAWEEAPGGPCDMLGAIAHLPAPGHHDRRNAAPGLAAEPHRPGHLTGGAR
jgi:hypothetical protein